MPALLLRTTTREVVAIFTAYSAALQFKLIARQIAALRALPAWQIVWPLRPSALAACVAVGRARRVERFSDDGHHRQEQRGEGR